MGLYVKQNTVRKAHWRVESLLVQNSEMPCESISDSIFLWAALPSWAFYSEKLMKKHLLQKVYGAFLCHSLNDTKPVCGIALPEAKRTQTLELGESTTMDGIAL